MLYRILLPYFNATAGPTLDLACICSPVAITDKGFGVALRNSCRHRISAVANGTPQRHVGEHGSRRIPIQYPRKPFMVSTPAREHPGTTSSPRPCPWQVPSSLRGQLKRKTLPRHRNQSPLVARAGHRATTGFRYAATVTLQSNEGAQITGRAASDGFASCSTCQEGRAIKFLAYATPSPHSRDHIVRYEGLSSIVKVVPMIWCARLLKQYRSHQKTDNSYS